MTRRSDYMISKKIKPKNVTFGESIKDKPKTWSSIPNASVGRDIENSINQSIKDGGVRTIKDVLNNKDKYVGKEVTTKKGNKITIKDLIMVRNIKKKNVRAK